MRNVHLPSPSTAPEKVFAILSCGVVVVVILAFILIPSPGPSSKQVVTATQLVATYATDYTPPSSLTQARSEVHQAVAVVNAHTPSTLTVQRSFTRGDLYWFDVRAGSYTECVSHVVTSTNPASQMWDPSNSLWAWVEYNGPCLPPY